MDDQQGRWITTKSGARVFIKNTNSYMNDKIRNKGKQHFYHGSNYDFEQFNMEKARQNNTTYNLEEGHYFTDDIGKASKYGKYVYEVELNNYKKVHPIMDESITNYLVDDDKNVKIVAKYKNNTNIDLDSIQNNINEVEKKYNSLLRFKEKNKNNKNIDFELLNKDEQNQKKQLKQLQDQYEKARKAKYEKIK